MIIDGKKISDQILAGLKAKIAADSIKLTYPTKLAIILVGDFPTSHIYVKNKMKAAEKVGILTDLRKFDSTISEAELLSEVKKLNLDEEVSGIIIQMPLPNHIKSSKLIEALDPSKDVDGFHPKNLGLLYGGYSNEFVPCTALGVLHLIEECESELSGKNAVVIGRSNIVGRPVAALLLQKDCSVTICHSQTKNLSSITSKADIIVSAIGRPKCLGQEYFNKDTIVIDVGINRITNKDKSILVGDVDFENVKDYVQHITKVPGGVGPMTVAYLLVNTHNANLRRLV